MIKEHILAFVNNLNLNMRLKQIKSSCLHFMSMPYRKDTELHHLKFDLKVFIENLAMKLHLIGIKKQIGVEAI